MIVINEEVLGRQLDKYGILSNQKALQFGIVLIKYYKYLGKSTEEIKSLLKEKIDIRNCDDELLSSYIYNTLIVNMNIHGEFRNQPITLNQKEVDILQDIKNDRFRRFTYLMIVLCKAFNNKLTVRKKEIMSIIGHSASTVEFDRMFNKLFNMGYIDASIMRYKLREANQTALYYCLTDKYIEDTQGDYPIIITIKDTNDPMVFYNQMFVNGDVDYCTECGAIFFKNIRQHHMNPICPDCRKFMRQTYSHSNKKH